MSAAMPAFDTYRYVRALKEAGFTEAQAEAQYTALLQVMDTHLERLATKDDLRLLASDLNGRMDRLESTLDGRMDTLESTLDGRMDRLESALNGRMDRLESTLGGRMDRLESTLDGRTDKLESTLNGRMDTLESTLNGQMDTLKAGVAGKFEKLEAKFNHNQWAIGLLTVLMVSGFGWVVTLLRALAPG